MDSVPAAAGLRTYIAQGEQAVGDRPDQMISTILGSCVAVCLWDARQRFGGMNHILLPEGDLTDIGARGFGASEMERLVNALLKRGASRSDLVAKVFGGASIVAGLSDIGARNAAFVFGYLKDEDIPCVSQSIGGQMARQVRFWPEAGRVRQRFVRAAEAPEARPGARLRANDLELL